MDQLLAASDIKTTRAGVVLPILQYPHPTLTTPASPVISDIANDESLQGLLNDMVATMKAARAAGLAAPQVGVGLRVLVVQDETGKVTKAINPRVVEVSSETERMKEGCLSFMGLFINVARPAEAVIEYFDETGKLVTSAEDGHLGRALLHEIDHLDGKTFLDRVSNFERREALRKNEHAKRKVKALQKSLGR